MESISVDAAKHNYRVDKFIVPAAARDEFLARVRMTHTFLKTLPGFVQDLVVDKVAGPGEYNIVTIVEWENDASIEYARAAVKAMHQQAGFEPREVMRRLGIKADLANYRRLDI